MNLRTPFALAAVVLTSLAGASAASACGNGGYSYAGIASSSPAYGIGALITPLPAFNVLSGHVAGWVGVGGPRQGPERHGRVAPGRVQRLRRLAGSNLYYEVTLPGGSPRLPPDRDGPPGRQPRAASRCSRCASARTTGASGSTAQPSREPIRLPGEQRPLAADRHGRELGRRHRRLQRLPLPLRPGLGRRARRAAAGGRFAGGIRLRRPVDTGSRRRTRRKALGPSRSAQRRRRPSARPRCLLASR